jgi:hypothetical protein
MRCIPVLPRPAGGLSLHLNDRGQRIQSPGLVDSAGWTSDCFATVTEMG